MRRKAYLSVLYCCNINNTRTAREDGAAWALLEFGCGIGIGSVEERDAFEKGM
jgi:hypothetical protein